MMGKTIPYSELGFRNLEEFIKSEPSLLLKTINGEKFVDAALSEKSSHIANLVQRQKPSKKKKVYVFY